MPIRMPSSNARHSNRTAPLLALVSLIAAGAVVPAVLAADNPGAHEHGHARLQMAVENNRVDLMFNSPAYNLAGFEHEARTEAEKNQLAEIHRWLETTPLVNIQAANCRVNSATVQLGGNMKAAHGNDHHDHRHEDSHGHHEHDNEGATHREFNVSQQLQCDRIGTGDEFTSPLMKRFQNLEELNVEWVGPSGQGSARLTPSARAFTLND